jgi:drug/metabolite transporter (DMT)-like permease
LGGVALLIGPRLFGTGATPLAALAMVGVACSYAAGNIFVRLMPVADPKRLALGQQLMSALFAGSFALVLHGPQSFAPVLVHWQPIVALGALSTGVPMLIYMAVLRAIGPTRASLTGYLVPTWAVIISALTLGEIISLREVIAGLIVLAGVWITSRRT